MTSTLMKANTSGSAIILTDRDRRLIAALDDFGILTREQIARLLQFGSVTRANAVLLRLTRHRYLTTRLQPSVRGTRRLTYTVGPAGRELLEGSGASSPRRWREASDLFVEHQLLVNDARLVIMATNVEGFYLERWLTERDLRSLNLNLLPDAYGEYRLHGKHYAFFLEADNGTESLKRWRSKVSAYVSLAFSGRFEAVMHRRFFRVLVVAPSPTRIANIQAQIAVQTQRIFWLTDLPRLRAEGPAAAIWRRPGAEGFSSLITP